MNKKNGFWILIFLSGVLITFSLIYYQTNQRESIDLQPNRMRGEIIEVKNGSIVVKGFVGPLNMVGREYERTIEFKLTSETIYKQQVFTVSRTITEEGPNLFTSSTEDKPGRALDLNLKTKIIHILSYDDLINLPTALASEVYYSTFNVVTTN